jgi:hypothetical protein
MDKIKIIVLIFLLQLMAACSSENAPECFREAGATITYEVEVPDFTSIHASVGIELFVTEGPETKVTIKTGENLKELIAAKVVDGELVLTNDTACNWVRDYNTTTVCVTTPHLEKIYSASQFAVKSGGVLTFPYLTLQSGIFSETASGTFELAVDCDNLVVEDNQSAYYVITGSADNLAVHFYSGDARFEGSDLEVQNLEIFHRSSNDIIAKPQQQVTGTLYSTGNLVLKSHPSVVEVERLYSGKIIYR